MTSERDDIRVDRLHLVQAVLAIDGGSDIKALKSKVYRYKLPNHLIVVNDEYPAQSIHHLREGTAFPRGGG